METSETLLTSQEAADILGVSVQTISKWVISGKLTPAKKLPGLRGAYLFTPAALKTARAAS